MMGEIGLQYEGLSPSDPSVDRISRSPRSSTSPSPSTWARAARAAPTSPCPSSAARWAIRCCSRNSSRGIPKLRVQVMHAGYPMIDNMLTLLQANSHVYVDVAGLIWSYPLKEVNRYIERLVDAGFGDRVMFGTDQLVWPKLMAYSISIIQNADYLTPEQKRDILYNNAARFLRLDTRDAK